MKTRVKQSIGILLSVLLIATMIPILPVAAATVSSSEEVTYIIGKNLHEYLKPDMQGDTLKEADLISGVLPEGLDWTYSDMTGLQLKGTPTKAGVRKVIFKCIGFDGGITNHTVTITVREQVISSSEEVTYAIGKNLHEYLKPDMQGDTLKEADLISGVLPEGLDWTYSDLTGLQLKGTPTKVDVRKVIFKCIGFDGGITNHTVTITIKDESVESAQDVAYTVGKTVHDYLAPNMQGDTLKEADLISGVLPEGLDWTYSDMTGLQLKGTPTKPDMKKVVFKCIGFDGVITNHTVTITVKDPSPVSSVEEIVCVVDKPSDVSLHPELQGQQLKTVTLTGGSMPNGMSYFLNEDYDLKLDGTPTKTGTYKIVFWCVLSQEDVTEHTVTITVKDPVISNPFKDINETDDYYNAVLWAYYASPQITNGMDETHFGPLLTVTRGQAVTFLWRSQGCPEPASSYNPFQDVSSSEYFYRPILWAVEKGITKGVDDTHFNPMDTLSTQHIVTFIYRTKNPGQDGWFGEAAAWAADSGGRPFGVNIAVNNTTPCPRCNVVQFLYKLSK